jgi:hypothetical protein
MARRKPYKRVLMGKQPIPPGRKYPKRFVKNKHWITAKELAAMLGVRVKDVREWCRSGKLMYQIGLGRYLFKIYWTPIKRLVRCAQEQKPFWREANKFCKKCRKPVPWRSLCNACMLKKWKKEQKAKKEHERLYGKIEGQDGQTD